MTEVRGSACVPAYVFNPWETVLAWELVADLVSLRTEFNTLAPSRDKASDGSIGDTAHQHESSDHNPDETGTTPYEDADNINEVHAIDVDDDLRLANWTMQKACDIIVDRHRTGVDDRLQNVIYNRRIASRSWGWTWRVYNGTSPHTEHAHFSSRYGSGTAGNPEANTRPWGLLAQLAKEEDDVTPDDINKVALAVWQYPHYENGQDTPEKRLAKLELQSDATQAKLDQLITLVSGLTPKQATK